MRTIFLDYETFYSADYTLKRLTPAEYILDPRFETIGAAIKEGMGGETFWLDGDELQEYFDGLDPQDTCLVSHNALFDQCITAWRYGFVPRLMVDTLGVSRAMLGHELKSLSLSKVAAHLGLGVKGGAVHKVIGMTAADIRANGLYDEYVEYSKNDADLCAGIYQKLVLDADFPVSELVLMDSVLRCAIQPQMQIDREKLAEHLYSVQQRKQSLLDSITVGKDDLMSNDKFAEALRQVGVEPPTKISQATGKETYAFARTDPDFMALEEHDDPAVQALHAARLGLKSTLEETRTQRFIDIANLQWPDDSPPLMPVPLRYYGAHTGRLSGDWKLNLQNMPRGGALRSALIAPPGHVVLAADASQIEARIVAWICGQDDLVRQFAIGEDVYSSFASKVFNKPINKKEHPTERFIGKTAILGLGYGLGWHKFQRTIKLQSKAQTGKQIELSEDEAQKIVDTYREAYSSIPATWRRLNNAIPILAGSPGAFHIGPCSFVEGKITLPSGLALHYHKLRQESDGWVYEYADKVKRMYGGSLLENIVQALARIVVMDAALHLRKKLATFDVQLALTVHDELVYVVPEDLAEVCKKIVLDHMSTPPEWAPILPLAAEADIGRSYGDAK